MLANAVHLFHYNIQVINLLPLGITIGLVALAWIFLFIAMEDGYVIIFSLLFGLLILVPALTMDWHHTETRKGAEIRVQIDGQSVWIPAKRLANGVYWPTTHTRKR